MNGKTMESLLIKPKKVGILGAGQLARMLAQAAQSLGLEPVVLATHVSDPAAQVCQKVVLGELSNPETWTEILSQVSLLALENEWIPVDLASQRAEERGVKCYPRWPSLYQLQDKIRQKEAMEKMGIPLAPWMKLDPRASVPDNLKKVESNLGSQGFVLKWAQGGYDGKGTWIPGSQSGRVTAEQFCDDARKRGIPLFAEKKISFKRELAIVGVHSIRGEFAAYPVVVTHQKNGICHRVEGPASAIGLSSLLESKIRGYAEKLARDLPLEGVFAIELFEDQDGEVWVNEIAPRVHNSGHFTLDGSKTSQFENHWRALLGMPLGSTECAPVFAMRNLLGPISSERWDQLRNALPSEFHFHSYGKENARAGRKLGHINAVGKSTEDLARWEKIWSENHG